MKKLYRAVGEKRYTGEGSCWTDTLDCARAYTDNPGFGGEIMLMTEVDLGFCRRIDRVLDLRDMGNWHRDIVDIMAELVGIDDIPCLHYPESHYDQEEECYVYSDTPEIFDDGEMAYLHKYIDLPEVRAILAKQYDWVVYEDSYPEDCTTYVRLTDTPIETEEVGYEPFDYYED